MATHIPVNTHCCLLLSSSNYTRFVLFITIIQQDATQSNWEKKPIAELHEYNTMTFQKSVN